MAVAGQSCKKRESRRPDANLAAGFCTIAAIIKIERDSIMLRRLVVIDAGKAQPIEFVEMRYGQGWLRHFEAGIFIAYPNSG
jgi:hypothetical protein